MPLGVKIPINLSSSRTQTVLTIGAGFALIYFITRFFRRKPFEDLPVDQQQSSYYSKNNKTTNVQSTSKKANGSLPPSGRPSTSSSHAPVGNKSQANLASTSNRRLRHSSFSSTASTVVAVGDVNHVTFKEHFVEETPILRARDYFSDAIKCWERALNSDAGTSENSLQNGEKTFDKARAERLEKILDKAYQIRDDLNELLNGISPEMLDAYSRSERYLSYSDIAPKSVRRTMSVLSDDSFASALEDLVPPILDLDVTITRNIESDVEELILYQEGLREVDALNVLCRVLRTEFLKCKSDDDFLAKLYGVRLAFDKLLEDEFKRDWLKTNGRALIGALLRKANKEVNGFFECYDKMLIFAAEPNNWSMIEDELRGRKLVEFSFYDIVLDFIFMDAFDDLANPPASVVAVAQNRFLSSKIIESTLNAVVWSVLKAKRTRLKYQNGFIAHFYDISEHVSPIMAWGFLGSNAELKELCNYFKSQICNFLIDLFNCERVRFTCVEDLAEDIWQICLTRAEMTREYLES